MPSISTKNNQHPLSGDFSMYYRGTYVSRRDESGTLLVMYVREVYSEGDGTQIEDLFFVGEAFDRRGTYINDGGQVTWPAIEINLNVPRMGYRLIGKTPVYLTMGVNNRTQKKGFCIDLVATYPRVSLNRPAIFAAVEDKHFEGRISRDLTLHDSTLMWRGSEIGSFTEGVLTLKKTYEHVRDFVCKLLERSSEVKSVVITDQ